MFPSKLQDPLGPESWLVYQLMVRSSNNCRWSVFPWAGLYQAMVWHSGRNRSSLPQGLASCIVLVLARREHKLWHKLWLVPPLKSPQLLLRVWDAASLLPFIYLGQHRKPTRASLESSWCSRLPGVWQGSRFKVPLIPSLWQPPFNQQWVQAAETCKAVLR